MLEYKKVRYLYFENNLTQGAVSLTSTKDYLLDYQAAIRDILITIKKNLHSNEIKKVCVAGLGAGTVSRLISLHLPQSECVTYEINTNVISIYQKFFMQDNDRFSVKLGDAYSVVKKEKFDLFIMDINDVDNGFFDDFSYIIKNQSNVIINTQTAPSEQMGFKKIDLACGNYIVYKLS